MKEPSGYRVIQQVSHDGAFSVLRAIREQDNAAVLLVCPVTDPPSPMLLDQLEHELALGPRLDPSFAASPRSLERRGSQRFLVLEHTEGQCLSELLAEPMAAGQFLPLAVGLAGALALLHAQNLLHGDLKPEHILVDPASGAVHLLGFGIARPLTAAPAAPPGLVEGTLAYLAPERTGRIQQPVDQRSDLYSLGVVFYQMLTGVLPLEADDALGWVHAQIARKPIPPVQRQASVPAPVSALVMKLLEKDPAQRYQSAIGLRHDLSQLLAQWQQSGHLEEFALGEQDQSGQFALPQRLYGRSREVARLQEALDQVAHSAVRRVVLVGGYSGVGKTSLVRQLYLPAVWRKGLFLTGKFDLQPRNEPYAAFAQMFRSAVTHILTGTKADLDAWRERLLTALGLSAPLLFDLVPELALVLGPQPPVPELPLTEARNRFHAVCRHFLSALAEAEQPLVLFVDDLQWADGASMALLADLLAYPEPKRLLLLGAYRSNELGPEHPLQKLLADFGQSDGFQLLQLPPLGLKDLALLVADSTGSEPSQAQPLTELVFDKTHGNPFFVTQFLTALSHDGLLTFNPTSHNWQWDIEQVQAQRYSEHVVDLMVHRLGQLPATVRQVLRLAACLGARGQDTTLCLVSQRSPGQVRRALEHSARKGLVYYAGTHYQFTHDRIQQAAYCLIPPADRAAQHLQIGRLLLSHTPAEALAEQVFDIVAQLNLGAPLLTEKPEKLRLAELNLLAGQRAKAATAFQNAISYFESALELLGPEGWENARNSWTLHFERAQCEWLLGHTEQAQAQLQALLEHPASALQRADVYGVLAEVHMTLGRFAQAVQSSIAGLQLLEVELSPHPSEAQVQAEYQSVWDNLGERPIEALLQLPPMSEPHLSKVLDMLSALYAPAYFTDINLLTLVSCRMVNLSIQHGNRDASTMGYAAFGRLLGPRFGRYEDGYQFGRLALSLVQKHGYATYAARIHDLFGLSNTFWVEHVRVGLDHAHAAYQAASTVGDLTYACYACMHIPSFMLVAGEPLQRVLEQATERLELVERAGYDEVADIIRSIAQLAQSMMGQTQAPNSFSSSSFDEELFETQLHQKRSPIAIAWYWILQLQGRCLAGDYEGAVRAADRAEPYLWIGITQLTYPEFFFYAAVALAAQAQSLAPQQPLPPRLLSYSEKLRTWASHGPDNFRCKSALVEAELARLQKRDLEAIRLYEKAFRTARESGFAQCEGLIAQRAALFCEQQDLTTQAQAYLQQASEAFTRWEAHALVHQLQRRYPLLRPQPFAAETSPFRARPEQLDLLAVVKASQAISRNISIPQLLETLMRVLLEQAGAERGCLLLQRQGQLWLAFETSTTAGSSAPIEPLPLEKCPTLPASVLRYVQRTLHPVLLDAVSGYQAFADDPWLSATQPRSGLCVPFVRQAELLGLAYLENQWTAAAFTDQQLTVLNLLGAQAAISLENAQLFSQSRAAEAEVRRINIELERRVAERTAALAAANKELEAFTYSVSHDLKAPVRRLRAFGAALSSKHAQQLGPQGSDYLNRMLAASRHMAELIDALLKLSRVAQAPLERRAVDLSAVAHVIAEELQQRAPERRIEFAIADGITAQADPRLVRIVLENLLENAWKYSAKKPLAQIAFGLEPDGPAPVYWVQDNGVGFAPELAEELFRPFQRLHSAEPFEGTGIGLATVSRIVTRHGGRLWATAQVDHGAQFNFTLQPEAANS